MQDKHARTEKPTEKKREDARRKGNSPRTTELSAALVMGALLLFFRWFGASWLQGMEQLVAWGMSQAAVAAGDPLALIELTRAAAGSAGFLLLFPVGLLAVASVSGNLLQGTPRFTLQPMTPDLSKINPFKGIQKLFRLKALVDLSKALIKAALFTTIVAYAVIDVLEEGLPGSGPGGVLIAVGALASRVMTRVVVLMLCLAVIDLLYTRWDWQRGLRMTKQEIKEENRQLNGDPQVKARIRRKQQEISRNRMMANVPRATVVVTNPTHYAVALRYAPHEADVPIVVARGANHMAARIREIAKQHNIPLHREPALARALYRAVRVGDAVPEALFRAVAEILALVLRASRRQGRSGPGTEVRR